MNGTEESAKCFSSLQMFWVLPKTIRMRGAVRCPCFKARDSKDQRGTLTCLRPHSTAGLKPKCHIPFSFHCTVRGYCVLLGRISLETSDPFITQDSHGVEEGGGLQLKPRKELRSTYNTGCWGQEEACLVHPGMNTEGEGRREGLSQWGARSQGIKMVLCSVLS